VSPCSADRATADSVSDDVKDYYDILDVAPASSADEIKANYRRLQKRYHPDVMGEKGHQLSAELNLAYQTLVDPVLRGQYDRRLGSLASSRYSIKRAPRNVPGLVGPIVDGEVLLRNMMPSSSSLDKKAASKEGRRLVVWLREWARTFVFASDLPLPLPVQCDDIDSGTRLAFITTGDGTIRSVGELLFYVESPKAEEKISAGGWAVEVRRICVGPQGTLPGEPQVLRAFQKALRDHMEGSSTKRNKFGLNLTGFAAAVVASTVGAAPLPSIPNNDNEGAAYEAYHLLHDSLEDSDDDDAL